MHRNILLAPQPYQTGSHHQLEVRERSKQHTFPLEHAQVHISDDSWYFTLYQPLAISWTSVQQGSYKCTHKKYSFHHAAMQRERTLLFTAVYPESPQSTVTSSLATESNARHSWGVGGCWRRKQQVHSRSSKATVCHLGGCPHCFFTWGTIYHMLRSRAVGSLCHNTSRNNTE